MQPVKGQCPCKLSQVYVKREGRTADMPAVIQAYRSARILPEIYNISFLAG